MDVQDLDVLVPEPKYVRLGGAEYKLPADMPMEIFLRVNLAGEIKDEDGNLDQAKQLEALIDTLSDLFTWETTSDVDRDAVKRKVEAILKRRGVKFSFELLKNIYREADVEESSEGPPDQAQSGADSNGTKSSSTSQSQESQTPATDRADSSA